MNSNANGEKPTPLAMSVMDMFLHRPKHPFGSAQHLLSKSEVLAQATENMLLACNRVDGARRKLRKTEPKDLESAHAELAALEFELSAARSDALLTLADYRASAQGFQQHQANATAAKSSSNSTTD